MKNYILLLYYFPYLLNCIFIIFRRVHCLVYTNVNDLRYYCWTDILFLFGMYHITNMEDIPFFKGKIPYRSYMNEAIYCTMVIYYFYFGYINVSVKDINSKENRMGNRELIIQRRRQRMDNPETQAKNGQPRGACTEWII